MTKAAGVADAMVAGVMAAMTDTLDAYPPPPAAP